MSKAQANARKEPAKAGGLINSAELTQKIAGDLSNLLEHYKAQDTDHVQKVAEFNESCTRKLKIDQEKADKLINDAKSEAGKIVAAATLQSALTEAENTHWKVEKRKIESTYTFEQQIKLDVGGTHFTTSQTTLRRFPDSMIGAMFSGRHALTLNKNDEFFVDRDGTHFRFILNFLRDPEHFSVDLPASHKEELKRETDYYGLTDLMFPFTKAADQNITDISNNKVKVSQTETGVWMGTNSYSTTPIAFVYCKACKVASLPSSFGDGSILNFFATRQMFDGQPVCSLIKPCKRCHRF